MQFLSVFLAYEGCEQLHTCSLGRFEGKESYDILANTIVPCIDSGIGKLNNVYILIMEGPEGFDYSLVDKNVCGELSSGMELPSTLEILPPAENHACYTARQKSDPAISFEFSRQGNQCLGH
jgi:hypothetical protein